MKNERIGVWFSLALIILALSAWLGTLLGAKSALYRHRSDQRGSLGNLSALEHERLESVLDELNVIGFFRTDSLISMNDEERLKKALPDRVSKFEDFGKGLKTAEAKPVFDMNLAFAYVIAAIVDDQNNNKVQAATHMHSAQSLFQTLGWSDYSEGTLRSLTERELNWSLRPPSSGGAK